MLGRRLGLVVRRPLGTRGRSVIATDFVGHTTRRGPGESVAVRPPMYTQRLASGIAARFCRWQALLAGRAALEGMNGRQPAGSGSGLCPGPSSPSPRRLPETEYAIEPNTMIESTLITLSTRVIAIASVGEMP
jgi:hypothetical protein